jgi:hypothetical protein
MVLPVVSEKVSHIDALVRRQKVNSRKLTSHRRPPALRVPGSAPKMKQKILIPYSLQQRICRMVQENPKVILRNFLRFDQ